MDFLPELFLGGALDLGLLPSFVGLGSEGFSLLPPADQLADPARGDLKTLGDFLLTLLVSVNRLKYPLPQVHRVGFHALTLL